MRAVDLIRKKRDGKGLSRAELEFLINGYLSGEIPDYQMAAFTMAVYFQGMSGPETTELTMLMARSGQILDLKAIPGRKVDKHSTGGVGDTTTLITAPLAASAGVPVAKVSGRGLGHTGGTVDKLESIPGYQVELSGAEFIRQIQKIGIGLVGQTGELAPADKLFYALRDVTATIESIPLIASSIMSKKIAAGADAFVLDVKVGRGAFMTSVAAGVELARTMVQIGTLAGKETVALVTDMNRPLGRSIGNALEVKEAILTLQGEGPANLTHLSLELAAEMLVLAGAAPEREAALAILKKKLAKGEALAKLAELIQAQGGDPRVMDDLSLLPQAPFRESVPCPKKGFIQEVEAETVGRAAMLLGAGRRVKEARIDLAVGIELKKEVGEQVRQGEEIAVVHGRDRASLGKAVRQVQAAFGVGGDPPASTPLIYAKITANDV